MKKGLIAPLKRPAPTKGYVRFREWLQCRRHRDEKKAVFRLAPNSARIWEPEEE
jgi:hypothetical protein